MAVRQVLAALDPRGSTWVLREFRRLDDAHPEGKAYVVVEIC